MSTFNTPVTHGTMLERIVPSAAVPSDPHLRFAQDPLCWIGVPQATVINAFATGAVARADGASNGVPNNAGSQWIAFQLSPIPQLAPAAFKAIPGGLPVMLVIVAGSGIATPLADDLLIGGSPLVTAPAGGGSTAFFAFAFQDRICRDPLSALEAIALSGACDSNWPQFVTDIASLARSRNVRIVDHRGAPLTAGSVGVSIDGGAAQGVLLGGTDGDTGIPVPAASVARVSFSSASHPIVASVDVDDGQFEGAGLTLAAGKRLVQVLDANNWLAAPDAGSRCPALESGQLHRATAGRKHILCASRAGPAGGETWRSSGTGRLGVS